MGILGHMYVRPYSLCPHRLWLWLAHARKSLTDSAGFGKSVPRASHCLHHIDCFGSCWRKSTWNFSQWKRSCLLKKRLILGLTLCTVKPFGFFFCENWSCENSSVLGGWRLWQVSRMLISCSLALLSQQRFRIADNEVRPVHHLSNQTGLFGRPKFASGTESASNTWIFVEICLESSTDGLKLSLQ